jgi:hypothetical protein
MWPKELILVECNSYQFGYVDKLTKNDSYQFMLFE